ncbi:hypothetical protein FHS78_000616 [Parvibaculum indicum]|uniref:hypothetical protein n=1 Tax=Parvibaculum indicum TaxID=562969 RepID=UPI00141E743A|nr:hypothetical protein [Parvibaculum indicum]NIJ40346.1 hypothetical protein [Parvibaculum indicum]
MARLKNFRAAVELTRSQLTGEARRQQLIDLSRRSIAEAEAMNRATIGYDVGKTVIVDGLRGGAIENVKPGGTVVALFAVHEAAIDFAWETIATMSPVDMRPDADNIVYRKNHLLMVNGEEVGPPPVKIEVDDVVTFVNLLPYARRLEKGWSKKQAPDGIYEVASKVIRARYGNVVQVKFGYGAFLGEDPRIRDNRYPYIELSPKRSRV